MDEPAKRIHLVSESTDECRNLEQEERISRLEKHFEYGGRVWTLEQYKTFLAGIWCAAMLAGGLIWYLVERLLEVLKK